MRRTALLVISLLVAVPLLAAEPAQADEVERFTACVALSPTTPQCDRQGAVLDAGATAYLRGRVSPPHTGFGEVWRRAPYSERFVKVGIMGINEQGRIRWSWVTDRDDVAGAPYTFQFRIPDHGRSWTTKVRVRAPRPTTVSLCAAMSSTDPSCYNAGATYEGGQTVFLRGRIRPEQAAAVEVLRQRPHHAGLATVATIQANSAGQVRWTWVTHDRDVDGSAPYLLALRLPGGERSNVVEVWIVHNDD